MVVVLFVGVIIIIVVVVVVVVVSFGVHHLLDWSLDGSVLRGSLLTCSNGRQQVDSLYA